MAKKTLPDTLSALLRVAVADAQACEAQPDKFELDMGVWFDGDGDRCVVCMAGSVIAQTLGAADLPMDLEPGNFGDSSGSVEEKLYAIDHARQGSLAEALAELGLGHVAAVKADSLDALDRKIKASWLNDGRKRAPWPVYLEVATELEALGL
jgi:hypothetical protein